MSVYEVGQLLPKKFDIVLFLGVMYHLRDPLQAFDELRKVNRRQTNFTDDHI